MWGLIISGITQALKGGIDVAQAVVAGKIAVTQKASENVATWEQLHVKSSTTSWKDEYVLILWTAPAFMAFVPGLHEYVLRGFQALLELPDWYTYTLVSISLASFGIKISDVIRSRILK